MVVTVVHEWVIKAECDFPLTGIMLAVPRSVASTAAETIKAYTVNLLCCPPLSLHYCHITSIYVFRFHLLLDLLRWVGGWYGGMPSGEKRQVAFREKNYTQLKESSVYTPDCSSWWSEQKTKRGEPSCCSPAALLILLSSQHLTNEAWFWTYSIITQEQHSRSNLFRIKATLSPEYVFNMYIFDLWGSEI